MNHFRERLRYENEITNCLTGDRIIICQGPLSQDIPRSITIGKYRATVMYRDQPSTSSRPKKCSKCLADGHNFSNCPNDWVCKSCGKEGHKQIDCVENDLSDNTQHLMNNKAQMKTQMMLKAPLKKMIQHSNQITQMIHLQIVNMNQRVYMKKTLICPN
ncbi:unnamed protein product [Mytilus edulis]|uniref:CCHC-type domain-containing protein n=1 Tax=Mytilus edulis TaxID=6550 RepID=A0A8S3TB36_MYTED|nr:unnamed protein product [Mytilus edulis]